MFQSTRPRGARLLARKPAIKHTSFNPRAHAGRDGQGGRSSDGGRVSIHAPTRGATTVWLLLPPHLFQSTRPRGARLPLWCQCIGFDGFNPRAHAGRDQTHCLMNLTKPFQSTRPRGARRPLLNRLNLKTEFRLKCVSVNTKAPSIVIQHKHKINSTINQYAALYARVTCFLCVLRIRITLTVSHLGLMVFSRRYVQPGVPSCCPGNKSAGCLHPDPSR